MLKFNKSKQANDITVDKLVKYVMMPNKVDGGYILRPEMVQDIDDVTLTKFCATYKNKAEQFIKMFPTAPKTDLLTLWYKRIEKNQHDVKHILEDKSLNDEDKRRKLTHRLSIIQTDCNSIIQAIECLQNRAKSRS